jgi:P-type Ca2+ transporter type 2C
LKNPSTKPQDQEDKYYCLTLEKLYERLQTQPAGLTSQEAENRLKQYGENEIKQGKQIDPLKIFFAQFHNFVVYILLVALTISFALGESVDAIVIGIIIVLNSVFGFVQEFKAEKSIEALKKMASPRANVVRDGKEKNIDAKELVPGDVVKLQTGDKVPSDARLIEQSNLQTSESSLTGESVPVKKEIPELPEKTALADRSNMVFAGTIVAIGRGFAVVTETGIKTEIGKIAALIQEKEEDPTPLQIKLDKLGKTLALVTIVICAVVFLAEVFKDGSFERSAIMEFFIIAVSLAVAAIPESLPAVVTIGLAIGVQRMVKRNALIRRLPSVETLGSTTVICSDKTGTLTKNEMTVKKIYANGEIIDLSGSGYGHEGEFFVGEEKVDPQKFELLLKIGMLNNDAAFDGNQVIGDPTEAALIVSAAKAGLSRSELEKTSPRKDEIPFTSERKIMTTIHPMDGADHAFVKGAAEIVIDLCETVYENGKTVELTSEKRAEIKELTKTFANQALRVLGFAFKELEESSDKEKQLTFVGLQAMIDPAREEVKEAIKKCHTAGIRVIMITGDHQTTASAIAKEIGIEGRVITGSDLENISDLENHVEEISVFARVNPEHKIHIVEALRKNGHIVAMTGDGVNDAPALKEADIGIAMGITGTDVSKEASDMILTDDNFSSIVNAVEEGRGIYDNIKKFVTYMFSSNLGEILTLFIAIMIGLPLPLIAIMILWINLVTDGLPALALSVEPIDAHIMQRGPGKPGESILSKSLVTTMILVGVSMTVVTLGLFSWYLQNGYELQYAQTVAFTVLTLSQLFNVLNCRSAGKSIFKVGLFSNVNLIYAVLLSFSIHLSVIYTPLRVYFKTVPLNLEDWVYIFFASSLIVVVVEIYKATQSPKTF